MPKVETKVIAGAAGGGAGGAVGTFLLWLLGAWGFRAGWSAADSQAAIAAVPGPVADLIPVVLGAAGAYLGGWLAPHTPRPDLDPPALVTPVVTPVVTSPSIEPPVA